MLLEWLGHRRGRPEAIAAAEDIGRGLVAALADPDARTGDIRGRGNTATFTDAVLRSLGA
jgi:3-isopropylmalate dehydrogenase